MQETTEERRHFLARNIRIVMAQQDVSVLHLRQVLEASKEEVGQKVNGKKDFSEKELKAIANFFNTTVEGLWGDVEKQPPQKYGNTSEVIEQEVEEEKAMAVDEKPAAGIDRGVGRKNREQSPAVRLIRLTDNDEFLKKLVEKTYLAAFTGKIANLEYYLRNNVLVRALKKFETAFAAELSPEERKGYVGHYLEQYGLWKEEVEGADEEIMAVSLLSNSLEDVLGVIVTDVPLKEYLKDRIEMVTNGQEVNIKALRAAMEVGRCHLKDLIQILDNYLHS